MVVPLASLADGHQAEHWCTLILVFFAATMYAWLAGVIVDGDEAAAEGEGAAEEGGEEPIAADIAAEEPF